MSLDQPKILQMSFDPNTIEHLGIKMYATLPPVIAEIVSNSFDAEAEKVEIWLHDTKEEKEIKIVDDGHGMTFDEINTNFLKIGRNRRDETDSQKSKNGKRTVIGKKGIGKLSIFGISKRIQIVTICKGVKNEFILDWEKLKEAGKAGRVYEPDILSHNVKTSDLDGTIITLYKVSRKTPFSPEDIAMSLSKAFQVFDEIDFSVKIYHNSKENEVIVSNDLRYNNLEIEHVWDFPISEVDKDFRYNLADLIKGKIILSKNTVSHDMNGIALFSRNKLVNQHEFYGVKSTSHGYSYLTGWLDIDFVDLFKEDVISTNRQSLNWETDETKELKTYLELAIRKIYNESVKIREANKVKEVESSTGVQIEEWIKKLPNYDGALARKLVTTIISTQGIDVAKAGELVKFVKDSFHFDSFKNFAKEIDTIENLEPGRIITLFKDWELIELREMYKLAIGRIETIKSFEKLIDKNALEVKEVHPFFEKFPWILDPRINMFEHEKRYSQLLREHSPEEELEVKDRRIDFLCTSVSHHRFIIELKRPLHEINKKDIDQAKDYRSFLERHCNTDVKSPNKVVAYVVGGSIKDSTTVKDEINDMQKLDKVYFVTYHQMLQDAQNYHKEFIRKYEELDQAE